MTQLERAHKIINLDKAWQESGGNTLMDGKTYQDVFDNVPADVLRAAMEPFSKSERIGVCMDDRNPDDGFYSGGGLILQDSDEALKQIHQSGITALKSHPGCGAGAVLAQRKGLSVEQGDAVAIAQSEQLAEKAEIKYAGPSPVDATAPHTARAALVFLDADIRRSKLRGHIPPAFFLSGSVYPNQQALFDEVLLTPQIAMNEQHAFGKFFSKDVPFDVVFISKNREAGQETADAFRAQLEKGIADETMRSKIRVQVAHLNEAA